MKWRKQVEGNMRMIGLRKMQQINVGGEKCKKICRSSGMHPATSSHWGLNRIKIRLMMMIMNTVELFFIAKDDLTQVHTKLKTKYELGHTVPGTRSYHVLFLKILE